MSAERREAPLPQELAKELFAFWREIFGHGDPDVPLGVFLGEEDAHNRLINYLERDGEGDGAPIAGTCGTTIGRANPRIAGFGEVATRPAARGRGIATRLCRQALEEFTEQGGEAIFLGTGNPAAARIYHRLGWRKLAGSNVWAAIASGASPEEYLVDYFRAPSDVSIAPGDASLRVPMIPLLLAPHDWQVLDGNLPEPMLSTRYATQNSCMGLCRRYYALVKGGGAGAAWFSAKTDDHRVVGIATARVTASNACNVDGFAHARFDGAFESLIEAAVAWGEGRGADRLTAVVPIEDEDKRARLEALGFSDAQVEGTFALGDRRVESVTLAR